MFKAPEFSNAKGNELVENLFKCLVARRVRLRLMAAANQILLSFMCIKSRQFKATLYISACKVKNRKARGTTISNAINFSCATLNKIEILFPLCGKF